MRRFLKIVFSRMTLVALAIIVQLLVSTTLPYVLNYFYPEIFGRLYVQIDLIIKLLGLIMFHNKFYHSKYKIDKDWVENNNMIIHYLGTNKPWKEKYRGILKDYYIKYKMD